MGDPLQRRQVSGLDRAGRAAFDTAAADANRDPSQAVAVAGGRDRADEALTLDGLMSEAQPAGLLRSLPNGFGHGYDFAEKGSWKTHFSFIANRRVATLRSWRSIVGAPRRSA